MGAGYKLWCAVKGHTSKKHLFVMVQNKIFSLRFEISDELKDYIKADGLQALVQTYDADGCVVVKKILKVRVRHCNYCPGTVDMARLCDVMCPMHGLLVDPASSLPRPQDSIAHPKAPESEHPEAPVPNKTWTKAVRSCTTPTHIWVYAENNVIEFMPFQIPEQLRNMIVVDEDLELEALLHTTDDAAGNIVQKVIQVRVAGCSLCSSSTTLDGPRNTVCPLHGLLVELPAPPLPHPQDSIAHAKAPAEAKHPEAPAEAKHSETFTEAPAEQAAAPVAAAEQAEVQDVSKDAVRSTSPGKESQTSAQAFPGRLRDRGSYDVPRGVLCKTVIDSLYLFCTPHLCSSSNDGCSPCDLSVTILRAVAQHYTSTSNAASALTACVDAFRETAESTTDEYPSAEICNTLRDLASMEPEILFSKYVHILACQDEEDIYNKMKAFLSMCLDAGKDAMAKDILTYYGAYLSERYTALSTALAARGPFALDGMFGDLFKIAAARGCVDTMMYCTEHGGVRTHHFQTFQDAIYWAVKCGQFSTADVLLSKKYAVVFEKVEPIFWLVLLTDVCVHGQADALFYLLSSPRLVITDLLIPTPWIERLTGDDISNVWKSMPHVRLDVFIREVEQDLAHLLVHAVRARRAHVVQMVLKLCVIPLEVLKEACFEAAKIGDAQMVKDILASITSRGTNLVFPDWAAVDWIAAAYPSIRKMLP